MALVPHVAHDIDLVTDILVADLPGVLVALMEQHPDARFSTPTPSSIEMKKIVQSALFTGNVKAITLLVKRGFVMSFGDDPKSLINKIIKQDCARRFELFVALENQRPLHDDEMMEIFNGAGPNVGKAFADLLGEDVQCRTMIDIIGMKSFDELTLKEFAFLLGASIDLEEIFLWHEIEHILPPHILKIAKLTTSSHGKITLKGLEPSLKDICGRIPYAPFYGLVSPSGKLVEAQGA